MAHYLVSARVRGDLDDLKSRLDSGEIRALRPFGLALDKGLRGARIAESGRIVWEEEDYCSPPLAMERAAVLDHYFDTLELESVREGEGWSRTKQLPPLWRERT